jgi:hypothetical protein
MTKVDETRRALLLTSATALVVLNSRLSFAQEIPSVQVTIEYLRTPQTLALLYNRFSLAWSLTISLYLQQNDASIDAPGKLDGLQLPPLGGNSEIWPRFRMLAEPGNASEREALISVLETDPDPLTEPERAEAHRQLVEKMNARLKDSGISPEARPVKEAVDSLSHVERIAAVTVDAGGKGSYFCRIFPFREVFC